MEWGELNPKALYRVFFSDLNCFLYTALLYSESEGSLQMQTVNQQLPGNTFKTGDK